MGKLEKGFAVGAVAAAAILGGVLYALYPNGFTPGYASENGEASTGYRAYDSSGIDQSSNTAAPDSGSTANQNPVDDSTGGSSSPQPSSNPGY